ncbi:MAG: hypothetical protein AAB289_07750 [Chloroflexota bacterium]
MSHGKTPRPTPAGQAAVPAAPLDARYEHREDVVDFHDCFIPRELVPLHVKIMGQTAGDEVPIAQLRFYCLSRDRGDWERAQDTLWDTVRPAIARRYAHWTRDGWEAAKPLDRDIVKREFGQDSVFIIVQLLLAVMTMGITFGFTHGRKDFYFRAVSAVLPLRRMKPVP